MQRQPAEDDASAYSHECFGVGNAVSIDRTTHLPKTEQNYIARFVVVHKLVEAS